MITPDQCLAKYGKPDIVFERKWMVFYGVPAEIGAVIPALPRRIYCNKDLLIPLSTAFQNIIDAGLAEELKTWDGCFNVRTQRGSTKPSIHSWAVAIDQNAAWNQLGKPSTLSPAYVECWLKAGFDWGGYWQGKRIDPMHFQLAVI